MVQACRYLLARAAPPALHSQLTSTILAQVWALLQQLLRSRAARRVLGHHLIQEAQLLRPQGIPILILLAVGAPGLTQGGHLPAQAVLVRRQEVPGRAALEQVQPGGPQRPDVCRQAVGLLAVQLWGPEGGRACDRRTSKGGSRSGINKSGWPGWYLLEFLE